MYRFLFSARWLGLGLVMVLAALVMVSLGQWQLDRYHHRSDINERIDAAGTMPAQPLAQVLPAPATEPAADVRWSRVSVTGRYDPSQEVIVRARTVQGRVGFEVVTPLVLADGSAVLVDRGWIPPTTEGAAVAPVVPPAPSGAVTVVGRVHAPESRASAAEPFGGVRSVRRIDPRLLAMPYPVYTAYLTLESQNPPADPVFVPITADHENATMNAGYVVQWWAFATLTVVGFCYLVVREKRSQTSVLSRTSAIPRRDRDASDQTPNAAKVVG